MNIVDKVKSLIASGVEVTKVYTDDNRNVKVDYRDQLGNYHTSCCFSFIPNDVQVLISLIGRNKVEIIEQAASAMPSGAGVSLGFNPFFGFNSPLPAWLWLLLIAAGFVVVRKALR